MNKFKAKKIDLKLYLEGIQFPINSISISEKIGSYPTSSISVPVSKSILDIDPRTLVHVFYRDSHTLDWLLIFEGEVSSAGISSRGDKKHISLSCVSVANHWEYALKEGTDLRSLLYTNSVSTSRIKSIYSNLNTSDKIPKEINELRKIISEGEDTHEFDLESLTSALSDLSAVLQTAFEESYSDEKFSELFSEVTNLFAKINSGYSIFHIILKIAERFSSFGNEAVKEFLTSKTGHKLFKLNFKLDGFSGKMSLLTAINLILSTINYKLIVPAAPSYDEENKKPQSFICMPDPYSFLPVVSNMFFKDDLISSSYNKNFLNEPTRVYGTNYPVMALSTLLDDEASETLKNYANFIVAPSNELTYVLTEDDTVTPQLSLTKKERMRGINAQEDLSDYGDLVTSAAAAANQKLDSIEKEYADKDTKKDTKKKEEEKEEVKKQFKEERETIDKLTNKYTQNNLETAYDCGVLASRNFNFSTVYSPYRVCGLPGVFIDDVMPSIIGLIGVINSHIEAGGRSSSSIQFIYPRDVKAYNEFMGDFDNITELEDYLLLLGWSKEDTVDNDKLKAAWPFLENETFTLAEGKKVDLGTGYSGKENQKKAWIDYIKHKLCIKDEINFLHGWFEKEKYFPNKIGTEIYKKLIYGLKKDKGDFDNPESEKAKFFKEAGNNFNGGIGKYEEEEIPFGSGLGTSWENSNWFSYYIGRMKTIYKDRLTGGTQHEFINKKIRRNVTTEKDYWNFILGYNTPFEAINSDSGDGVRSIMTSFSKEISRINSKRSEGKNPLFILERMQTVLKIKNELLVTNK